MIECKCGSVKIDTMEEFIEWIQGGGWEDYDDWMQSIGVTFREIEGKFFNVIHNRVFLNDGATN